MEHAGNLRAKRITIIGLGIVCLAVWSFIGYDVYLLHQNRNMHMWHGFAYLHHPEPLSASNVSIISSWMTFDYIDIVFRIPPTFLKDDLNIVDSHYPRLTIAQFATKHHLPIPTLVEQIQTAVKNYLEAKSSTQ